MKKYIPLLVELIMFIICVFCLVVITKETKEYDNAQIEKINGEFVMSTPRYKKMPEKIVKKKTIAYNPTVNNDIQILSEYIGNISFYGPDCGGCKTSYTASGYDIGNGNIYYHDNQYGNVYIVASDGSFPFGTILKMNIFGTEKYGIILDRGDIGFGRKFLFDVLVSSEEIANKYGVSYNSKIDVIRLGF